jgi:hypothetical protein
MEKLEFYKNAKNNVHFEFNAGEEKTEVEIYIGGYFLASVNIKDISEQARYELFENPSFFLGNTTHWGNDMKYKHFSFRLAFFRFSWYTYGLGKVCLRLEFSYGWDK